MSYWFFRKLTTIKCEINHILYRQCRDYSVNAYSIT